MGKWQRHNQTSQTIPKRSAIPQQVITRHQQTDVHESITKQDRNNINNPQKKWPSLFKISHFILEKQEKRLPEITEYAEMRHSDVILSFQWCHRTTCSQRAADVRLYVFVPEDKAANNDVVVWRLYYINTLKRELVDTDAYKLQPSISERVIVDGHDCHTGLDFGVKAKENQDKSPTLYWLP